MSNSTAQPGWEKPTHGKALILEAWSQGLMLGALIIMTGITIPNMRRDSLLHKLILIELLIAWPDCFAMFWDPPVFGWYLSSTSTLMISSWTLHNVIAWKKSRPFLKELYSWIYISTVGLAQAYWVLEIYANFAYFNGINQRLFPKTRPYEALCRDAWWIFTTLNLFYNIKYRYDFTAFELIKASPRFAIMLISMGLSIVFIVVDVLAVTTVFRLGGLNPFWKFAFIFKCFTDTIILDDFKTVLDKLFAYKQNQMRVDLSLSDRRTRQSTADVYNVDSKTGNIGAIHVETEIEVSVAEEPQQQATPEGSINGLIPSSTRKEAWSASCNV